MLPSPSPRSAGERAGGAGVRGPTFFLYPPPPPGAAPPAPCDRLLQNCPAQRTCHPADADTARDAAVKSGATSCELTGSAPPGSFCVMSLECDAREACVFVEESQAMLCATLC